MRPWGMAVCLGAAATLLLAEDRGMIVLPVASEAAADKGPNAEDVLVVELDDKGMLFWKGKARTLDEFATILDQAKRIQHLKRKANAGRKTCPGDGKREAKPPELCVRLRAHKETAWLHVQWLMAIMAEKRLHKFQFAVTTTPGPAYSRKEADELAGGRPDPPLPPVEANLDCRVPGDNASRDRRKGMEVSIEIIPRVEIDTFFGPAQARQKIARFVEVRYRHGVLKTADLTDVGKWIVGSKEDMAPARIRGEIKAGRKMPFKYVVAVLNQFHKAGVKDVHFDGTQMPTPELRRKKWLPYPKKNYVTAERSPR